MRRIFLCLAVVLSLTQSIQAQDARIKWCQDMFAKLGRAVDKQKQEAAGKPKDTPVSFPLDLTKLDPNDLDKASQQIRDAQGQDFLVADYATLARPEIQEVLRQAPGRLVLKVNDGDANVAHDILGTHTKKVSLLLAIPTTTEEVKHVFGEQPNVMAKLAAQQLQEINASISQLHSSKEAREVVVERAMSAKEILTRIQNAEEGDFIVLVGHNENNVVKLPSGDAIDIALLNEALSGKKLKGIVLTCESIRCIRDDQTNQVVTNRKLRFDEIACALQATIAAYVADASCGCSDNILRDLSQGLVNCFGAKDAKFKIMVGVVGGAVVTAVIVELVEIEIHHPGAGNAPATGPTTRNEAEDRR